MLPSLAIQIVIFVMCVCVWSVRQNLPCVGNWDCYILQYTLSCELSRALIRMFTLCLVTFKVFHNCSCVTEAALPAANMSAVLGQCSRENSCDRMFKFYMGMSVLGAFISACGATPAYIILLRYSSYITTSV